MKMDTLDDACVAMHEWFVSLMQAGFTEEQAIRFIAYMTAANRQVEGGEDG